MAAVRAWPFALTLAFIAPTVSIARQPAAPDVGAATSGKQLGPCLVHEKQLKGSWMTEQAKEDLAA